jgi:NAD(P)-dependent dehydrogenase (short-subunit alcohol dehydrogenase family)
LTDAGNAAEVAPAAISAAWPRRVGVVAIIGPRNEPVALFIVFLAALAAGIPSPRSCQGRPPLTDIDPELFDAHIAVKLRAPFLLMQAAVADIVRRGEPGTINIMTMSAHGGQSYWSLRGGVERPWKRR